jgi:DNA-binding transcriptional ArsR family regulator
MAYLWEIESEHNQEPDLITTRTFQPEINDELYRESLHFGNVKGRNDLEESELLVVLGCPSLSDDHIKRRAALLNEAAEVATDEDGKRLSGDELDYQNDVANDIYESIKNRVFQAMLRAGRTDNVEATVYVGTSLIPDWLNIMRVGCRVYPPDPNKSFDACTDLHTSHNSKRRVVIEAIRGSDGMTAKEIQEEAGVSQPTAKKHRESLRDAGYVCVVDYGPGKSKKFADKCLDQLNPFGTVDLSPVKGHHRPPQSSTHNNINGDLGGYDRPSHSRNSILSDRVASDPYDRDWIYEIECRADERKKDNLLEWRNRQDGVLPYTERRKRRSRGDSDEVDDDAVGWGTPVNGEEIEVDDSGSGR